MARNDVVLLDGIIDERVANRTPSEARDEAFEYFGIEQILKDADLTSEQLIAGLVDGRGDGGIDAVYVLINGHLVNEIDGFLWPRAGAELIIHVLSCKHHESFKQATIDALLATLTELFDFSLTEASLSGAYSESLIQARRNIEIVYRKLSTKLRDISIHTHYISRGDTSSVGKEVLARAKQVERLISDYFGSCSSMFHFHGAAELVAMHRRTPNYSLELQFVSHLSRGERYIVLSRLPDYYRFVTDGTILRRYLFDSNVRDFMGLTRTNEDIRETLGANDSPDFWWLNNGITILATSASIVGNSIQVSNVQIVNGLQTTESIFRHFETRGYTDDDNRCVLVKIIVSQDAAVRDAIIRATNNQTTVELSSLHATDKIQRDIEDVFSQQNMTYERRKNAHLNDGHAQELVVTPMYLAAGSIALLHRMLHKAPALKSKFMRNQSAYDLAFSPSTPLGTWPAIARILKQVDEHLESWRPAGKGTDRFLKERPYLVAYLLLTRNVGTFVLTPQHLAEFDPRSISRSEVGALLELIDELAGVAPPWTSRTRILSICRRFAGLFSVKNFEALENSLPRLPTEQGGYRKIAVTAEFVEKVYRALPKQPWKPGVNKILLRQLSCSPAELSSAIDVLVERGNIYRQRNGVLFDLNDNVVGFDPERVNPQTLELHG